MINDVSQWPSFYRMTEFYRQGTWQSYTPISETCLSAELVTILDRGLGSIKE
jgi:hypothetical protein